MRVADKTVVTINYTLTDPNGKVIDASKEGEPLAYLHGVKGIVPGLEEALDGKDKGESIKISLPPEKGYGNRDANMVQDVPRNRFPADIAINPGMQFQANTPQGPRIVTVVSADDQSVKIDANHPLAGMTLNFAVTIVDVRAATPEEITHGHVHGAGGHHH